MLVDACHSATMLDLKYGYMVNAKDTYTVSRKALPTSCEVISLSGCRDNQTSADAWEFDPHENKNEAQGAMTASFIANYKDGIEQLLREPTNHKSYAIDKYWFRLQAKDNWFLIIPLTVTQREDYSDIEKRPTNYTRAMLDLDKVAFMKWQNEQRVKAGLGKFTF